MEHWAMGDSSKRDGLYTATAEQIRDSIERHVGLPPDELTAAALREAGCLDRVAVLPADFNERVSYIGNLLAQMLMHPKRCDDRLRGLMGTLSQSLSYMLNSTSWADGKLHDFDSHEMHRKLQRFAKPPADAMLAERESPHRAAAALTEGRA